MNHSKAFWAVRNRYAEQMRNLWSRQFTGEGLWGRGTLLSTGEFEKNTIKPEEHLPEHLCGGTYRSRGRKRKVKQARTYQEQKERRIMKKFGANGVALGEDKDAKRKLEKGRSVAAKPRVAGSARGRDLRAAAALARFDQQKKEEVKEEKVVKEEDISTTSEAETDSGDDYEDDEADSGSAAALDINGAKLVDGKGRGLIKVCEDEAPDDPNAQQELRELQSSMQRRKRPAPVDAVKREPVSDSVLLREVPEQAANPIKAKSGESKATGKVGGNEKTAPKPEPQSPRTSKPPKSEAGSPRQQLCSVCSFGNGELSVTCTMCSNVLRPGHVPGTWSCQSRSCQGSKYLNAGDCGVCGVCGQRRMIAG
jgi:hypothetical protein